MMSRHTEWLRQQLNGATITAAAEGIGMAVAVTNDEVVAGKAGLFGRWGTTLERFPLSQLSNLRTIPNPAANLLTLEFTGTPARSLTVMYNADSFTDFERLIALLQPRATAEGSRP